MIDKRALGRAVDDVAAVVDVVDASACGSKGCQNPHRRNWACEKSGQSYCIRRDDTTSGGAAVRSETNRCCHFSA